MKLLVTGSTGFIGKNLCKAISERDVTIFGLSTSNGTNLAKDSLSNFEKVDLVLHLAAKTFVPNSFKNPEIIYRENYLSMLNILEYCRLNSIKKLIFLSSYVYGKPDYLPIDEKHKTHIENPYGRSKLHCESLCNSYAQDYGLNIIVLRPFNIYGNGQNKVFLIPTIINQLLESKKDIIEVDNLKPKRDYLYINDFIDILTKIIFSYDITGYKIFNIGSGISYSVKEIISIIMNTFGINKKYIDKKIVRKNEIMDCYANISKVKKEFSWEPKYNLVQGITDMKKSLL